MTCDSDLLLNPGSDFIQTVTVTDEGGDVDLTGYVASVHDVTGLLAGAVTVTVVGAQVRLAVVWQAGWPVVPALLGEFRVRIASGATEIGSFLVRVFVVLDVLEVIVARGADMTVSLIWPDDGGGADLSGDVIDLVNVSPALVPFVSVAVTDAATRTVAWHIEGDVTMPLGVLGAFQMRRATAGANRRTQRPIRVVVK